MGSMAEVATGQYLVPGAPGKTRLEERDLAGPGSDEVQIAVRATTLCGSDIHYFQHGRNGSIEVREPLCLGHEASGVVVAAGIAAGIEVGARVAIECGVAACGNHDTRCGPCLAGRYNICPRLRFRGSGAAFPHFQGTLQSRINHPAAWVHRLPSDVSYEEGALLEPLCVAVHACNRVAVKPRSRAIIVGAGAIGLLCAVAARSAGCESIAIADIAESRVAFALAHGYADVGHVVRSKRPATPEESLASARSTAASISALILPSGEPLGQADYTFECTGVEVCVQAAIFATQSGGKVALVGMGTPNILMPISEASAREIDILPTWRYAGCYPTAMRILSQSRAAGSASPLQRLITHRFTSIDMVPIALRTASSSVDEKGDMVIKVVVTNEQG